MEAKLIVLTQTELEILIQQTWNQSRQVTEMELRERWMSIPEVASFLKETPTNINKKIKAGHYKYVRFKGLHKQLLYSEVLSNSKK